MDRSSRRRIWKVEELLSAAKKEREEKRKKWHEVYLRHARLHATAVAAIVLSGEPKIDEPLSEAWTRALQHYRIETRPLDIFATSMEKTPMKRQVEAAEKLAPIILPITLKEAEKSARFTEIFKTAPVWLLNFTLTFIDAACLKFALPNKPWKPKWGTDGYEQSLRWPLLPSCTMTSGDPVPDEDARLWPLSLKWIEDAHNIQDLEGTRSQKQEDNHSPAADLLEDLKLFLDLAENPEKEKELSRYQKLRLWGLVEDLSSSK